VGGLLALFLGASVITLVEIFDIVLCRRPAYSCACSDDADRKRKHQQRDRDRKSVHENSSNHVTSSLSPGGANQQQRGGGRVLPGSKSATLPSLVLSNSKTSSTSNSCATVPRQKAVCTQQAETDI